VRCAAVIAILVREGADDRHAIGQGRHLRQLAAEFDAGKCGFRGTEQAPVLDRDVHLGVERFQLRRAAVQEEKDYGALAAG
jgi:hypothetical protein